MSSPVNPYESPVSETGLPPAAQAEYMQVARRPATPIVVGIISLVFATLGLIGQAMLPLMLLVLPAEFQETQQEAIAQGGYSREYIIAMWGFGVLMSLWLMGTAVGLLKYKRWGRIGFNVYALIGILSALYGVYMASTQIYPTTPETAQFESAQRIAGAASSLLGMLFPILGLAFLNRRHVVASLR